MSKFKTLTDYNEEMQRGSDSTDVLVDLLVEISRHYAYLAEQHIFMNLEKAAFEHKAKYFYTENGKEVSREKPLSDAGVENRWRISDKGAIEYRTKKEKDALEKISKHLNTVIFQRTMEARRENG